MVVFGTAVVTFSFDATQTPSASLGCEVIGAGAVAAAGVGVGVVSSGAVSSLFLQDVNDHAKLYGHTQCRMAEFI